MSLLYSSTVCTGAYYSVIIHSVIGMVQIRPPSVQFGSVQDGSLPTHSVNSKCDPPQSVRNFSNLWNSRVCIGAEDSGIVHSVNCITTCMWSENSVIALRAVTVSYLVLGLERPVNRTGSLQAESNRRMMVKLAFTCCSSQANNSLANSAPRRAPLISRTIRSTATIRKVGLL